MFLNVKLSGQIGGPINVNDLIVQRSDRSGVDALTITIHRFPANASSSVTPAQNTYTFWYRPRTEKGETWITVPELGLHHHHIHRENVFVSPPGLPVFGEWEGAAGLVVNFSFSRSFFEAMAKEFELFEVVSKPRWHHFFAIDQRTEALCRLLMEETEDQCPHGPLYFEPLVRALALRVLGTIKKRQRKTAVPPGIRRAVELLESHFAEDLSLDELASLAKMSRSHFAVMFRQLTGYTPHQYLLLVRLNHARRLIGQRNPPLSLAEIAATIGFCDQAHLNRHFRRFFGTTPAAFRFQQSTVELAT
jgi:AraC-like DNA-binding protein